ncbi:MAG: DUF2147 domain-containing protein [Pseudomonadota bacterium]
MTRFARAPWIKAWAAFGLGLVLGAGPALADPVGTWTTEGGLAQVRVAPCGAAFCGTIVWVKDPARKDAGSGGPILGLTILTGLTETGAGEYRGRVYNPEDGRTYTGFMTIEGDRAALKGCVVRPLCKTQTWTR